MIDQGGDLARLKFQVDRGLLVSGMKASQGWKLLEEEIQKILEAYRARAVDPKLVGQSYEHATIVGGHNALKSLLDLLQGAQDRGQVAAKRLKEAEDEQRETEAQERKLSRV